MHQIKIQRIWQKVVVAREQYQVITQRLPGRLIRGGKNDLGYTISESTPQKLKELENLASSLGFSKELTKIASNGDRTPVETGQYTWYGEPIVVSYNTAAMLTIKSRKEDSFNLGARMFIRPTDDGRYIFNTTDRHQSWKKNSPNFPKFKEGDLRPLSKAELKKEVLKFKKFYEM